MDQHLIFTFEQYSNHETIFFNKFNEKMFNCESFWNQFLKTQDFAGELVFKLKNEFHENFSYFLNLIGSTDFTYSCLLGMDTFLDCGQYQHFTQMYIEEQGFCIIKSFRIKENEELALVVKFINNSIFQIVNDYNSYVKSMYL